VFDREAVTAAGGLPRKCTAREADGAADRGPCGDAGCGGAILPRPAVSENRWKPREGPKILAFHGGFSRGFRFACLLEFEHCCPEKAGFGSTYADGTRESPQSPLGARESSPDSRRVPPHQGRGPGAKDAVRDPCGLPHSPAPGRSHSLAGPRKPNPVGTRSGAFAPTDAPTRARDLRHHSHVSTRMNRASLM
jgi:hypothetical protein